MNPIPPTRRGFTLIELLTVIGIIALLMAIALPAQSRIRDMARKRNAARMVTSLHHAFEAYYVQFNVWPTGLGSTTTSNTTAWLMGDNPKLMRFLELSTTHLTAGGALADPWGNLYRFAFDSGYTRQVTGPGGQTINADCIVWSFGPDGVDNTKDDISSR